MHVDPLTFAAQVVNFLVLVAILKRFLYRPLLNVMAEREKRFVDRQAEVDRKLQEAEQTSSRLAAQEAELAATRTAALQKVAAEAEDKRREYYDEARRAVDAEAEKWRRALENERVRWVQTMRHDMLDGIVHVTRKVLSDLASTDLEAAVVDRLLQRLESLSAEQRTMLAAQRGSATVHSSMALVPMLQSRVEVVLRRLCPQIQAVAFVADRDGLGVEVTWPGYSLGWTADGYIQEVVSAVGQVLDGVAHAPAA